ncbi:hypothetical protein [Chryseobacterium rhizosphaerae]|uniref:hypothetical protein n=1 Tax=Chryseobacterium rhizosphaerae TaxID=395937 RepID=UPI002359CF4F|nr:hypothetical protein [Chryseobacterium rhizosphaerae]MDC8102212.1 hypothetical protein [Chryseobacterium rhizosphaerae]
MNAEHENNLDINPASEIFTEFIPAVRLLNNSDTSCTFEKGKIPSLKHIPTTGFWFSTKTEEWEKNAHVAPRRQYVITIKGNIKFKVSDGSTFIIEPGIVLLAEDVMGEGHSWEMVESKEWERLYIPMTENTEDFFIPDPK